MELDKAIKCLKDYDPWERLPSGECDSNPSDAFQQGYRFAIERLETAKSILDIFNG